MAADKDAKKKWRRYKRAGFPPITYDAEECGLWRISINGKTVTKHIPTRIYNHRWINRAKRFWKRRFNLSTGQINMIDWGILKRTQAATTQSKRKWRTKHMSHTGPTGINLECRKARPTATCPQHQCNIPEDHLHIIQCKGPRTDDTFTKSMEDLDEWMAKKCSVSLKQTIEMIIRAAHNDTEPNWDSIEDDDT